MPWLGSVGKLEELSECPPSPSRSLDRDKNQLRRSQPPFRKFLRLGPTSGALQPPLRNPAGASEGPLAALRRRARQRPELAAPPLG